MRENIASLVPYLTVAALLLAIFAYVKSTQFFSALLAAQPSALDKFRRGAGLPQYGPIAPEKFRYLNSKQFISLQDPELRCKGALAYFALVAYAISFMALLLAALVWAS